MMWNWAAAVLSVEGAALVAFDGSPGHPDLAALWRVSAEEGVTHLGASPKYAQHFIVDGVRVVSTGYSIFLNILVFFDIPNVDGRGKRGQILLLYPTIAPFRALAPVTYILYMSPTPLARLFRPLCRYFGACKQKGVVPAVDCAADGADGLENLRTILSTGSPLLPEHFQWIYEVCT